MNLEIVRNDITNMKVDAIVLPANKYLKEGSGTSKAIFEKAGRVKLEKACSDYLKKHKNLWIGSAVLTGGFDLDADYIIHAVLPKWIDGEHDEYNLLSTAYLSSLELSDLAGCKTVAFPLLASGNNRFDAKLALDIAVDSINAFKPVNKLEKVFLVLYGMRAVAFAKERGYEVDEIIDQKYVLENNEDYKNGKQRAADQALGFAAKAAVVMGKYAGLFAKDGIELAQEYMDNPENRKKLLEKGAEIAINAAQQAILKKCIVRE